MPSGKRGPTLKNGRHLVLLPLLVLGGCRSATPLPHVEAGTVVLSLAVAPGALHQCSRATPVSVSGYWLPSATDTRRLDSDLGKLSHVSSKLCCMSGFRVVRPKSYFRQYIGVEVDGQRLIYINAFDPGIAQQLDWLHEPVVGCDGGTAFWGALYNPQTRSFSAVAFNGIS
jgi:hypothetical protein